MNIESYISYLLSTPMELTSCVKLGQILRVTHDQVNRTLANHDLQPEHLYAHVKAHLDIHGGQLSVDDTVLDKPHSKLENLVGTFWSGKHHRVVKEINLIVLVYTDHQGRCMPINFRIYDPHDKAKSKHRYLMEMVQEVLKWGLKPRLVTADSWYSAGKILRFLRAQELGFLMGVKRDRTVSDQPHQYQRVDTLELKNHQPHYTHLREFGFVHVYRTEHPDQETRYYVYYDPEKDNQRLSGHVAKPEGISYEQFKEIKRRHWHIEQLFYVIKRNCRAEKFFVRMPRQVHNHLFCMLQAYQKLTIMVEHKLLESVHSLRTQIYQETLRNFIQANAA